MSNLIINITICCVLLFVYTSHSVAADSSVPAEHESQASFADADQISDDAEEGMHALVGFQAHDTIPIAFPLDICLMLIQNDLYAASLHLNDIQYRNATSLTIFKKVHANGKYTFERIFTEKTNGAKSMDCNAVGTDGYVAIVNQFDAESAEIVQKTSPIYQISNDTVNIVQYFAQPNQNRFHLSKFGNNMFLSQTFLSDSSSSAQVCPIYKWSGMTFTYLGGLPCLNTMQIESFIVDSDVYVAAANYRNEKGDLKTDSFLFKLNVANHRFELLQKFRTNGARYVKYVHVVHNGRPQHFLMIANSGASSEKGASNAIVYKYTDGLMMAYQEIYFENVIRQFLPVLGSNNEFVLLVVQDNMEVKTFQFNGKSFAATDIQFTGGSFGKGVSSLRTYNLDDEDVIVVANEEMFNEATNLFVPKFRFEKPHVKFPFDFEEWYELRKEKLRNTELANLVKKLEEISVFLDKTVDQKLFNGILVLENSTVNVINANSICTKTISMNTEEWSGYIKMANEIIAKSEQNSNFARDQLIGSEHPSSMQRTQRYDNLHVLKNINVESINNYPISNYIVNFSNWMLKSLSVNDLIIRNDVAGYSQIYSKLRSAAETVRANKDANKSITVEELTLHGTLNGYIFDDIIRNALKINDAEQFIEATANFNSLAVADSSVHLISGLSPANMIRIDEGTYWIDQDIRFTEPVLANQIIIKERLNHINVKEDVLDVIFRRSRTPQELSSQVTFESLILLEPILLSGRIHSKSLDKMKPIVTIDEPIELTGDFQIIGNVSIGRMLMAKNLVVDGGTYSADRLQKDGIHVEQTVVNVPILFAREVTINDLADDVQINEVKMSSLVKSNTWDAQQIIGEKVFLNDIQVYHGTCDAIEINGVNLEQLNQTIVKRTAKDQIITGTIRLNQIVVDSIDYASLELGGKSVANLVTTDSPQTISGHISVKASLIAAGDHLNIDHLVTHNNMFGANLSAIVATAVPRSDRMHISGHKWFQNVTIDRILFEHNDFWGIGSTKRVQELLDARNNDLLIGQSTIFHRDFVIDELIFTDFLNGISSADFGKQWLLFETDQAFTVPAVISQIVLEDKLVLNGFLNGLNIDALVSDSLMKDSVETVIVKDIIFENLVIKKNVLLDGQYSGLRIPHDILLRKSQTEQMFSSSVVFANYINVTGNVYIEYLNGVHLDILCDLMAPPQLGFSPYGLEVNGEVLFTTEPIVDTLNGQIFNDLLTNAWFTTDTIISLSSDALLERIDFIQGVTVDGTLNGHSIQELARQYFSLSQPQTVQSFLTVRGNIMFESGAQIKHLLLEGNLHTCKGNELKIDDFARLVLKNGMPNEPINAAWAFEEIVVEGDLTAVLINGLNLIDDIVRYSGNNNINGEKIFENLHIDALICRRHCSLQNIRIANWMEDTPSTQFNHTIQGTITLIDPTIPSELSVLGTVNGQAISPKTILLRGIDQHVQGNVFIEAASSATPQILPITFEHVNTEFLNNVHFAQFYQNLVRKPEHGLPAITLQSSIRFQRPLTVGHLTLHGQFYEANANQLPNSYNQVNMQHYQRSMDEVAAMQQELHARLRNSDSKHFNHLIVRQIFGSEVRKVMQVRFPAYQFGSNLMAVHNVSQGLNAILFYVWSYSWHKLVPAEELLGIRPTHLQILDFFTFPIGDQDCIVVLTQDPKTNAYAHSFFLYWNGNVKRIHSVNNIHRLAIVPLNVINQNCFGTYEPRKGNFETFCIQLQIDGSLEKVPDQHQHLITNEVLAAISIAPDALLLHHQSNDIGIWHHGNSTGWILRETFKMLRNSSHMTAIEYNSQQYIAGCSYGNQPNDLHGFIDIYRDDSGIFSLKQIIENIPSATRCRFVIAPSHELLLYVVTNSAQKPLIAYKYRGLAGFEEIASIDGLNNDGVALAADENRCLEIMKDNAGHSQFIAFNFRSKTQLIESIFV